MEFESTHCSVETPLLLCACFHCLATTLRPFRFCRYLRTRKWHPFGSPKLFGKLSRGLFPKSGRHPPGWAHQNHYTSPPFLRLSSTHRVFQQIGQSSSRRRRRYVPVSTFPLPLLDAVLCTQHSNSFALACDGQAASVTMGLALLSKRPCVVVRGPTWLRRVSRRRPFQFRTVFSPNRCPSIRCRLPFNHPSPQDPQTLARRCVRVGSPKNTWASPSASTLPVSLSTRRIEGP